MASKCMMDSMLGHRQQQVAHKVMMDFMLDHLELAYCTQVYDGFYVTQLAPHVAHNDMDSSLQLTTKYALPLLLAASAALLPLRRPFNPPFPICEYLDAANTLTL